jgi:prepilin-type N-terminal cleavage/methylation domain-containing protein
MKLLIHKRTRHGMTILEVILALAVFGTAAVALVQTINKIAEVSLESQKIQEVEQTLESLIDEQSKTDSLREQEISVKPGADGVKYSVKIQEVKDLRSKEGQVLSGLYRISAVARWDDGEPMEISAETLRNINSMLPK